MNVGKGMKGKEDANAANEKEEDDSMKEMVVTK